MMEPTDKERTKSEAVDEKSAMLTVRVLWACHAFNATPEEAARQVVADLYAHLSRGGSVSLRVQEMDGREYTLVANCTCSVKYECCIPFRYGRCSTIGDARHSAFS